MKLGHDTASVINWISETQARNGTMPIPAIGDTMAELMWTDRKLLICTAHTVKGFIAKIVRTRMRNWAEGTTYPERDSDGNLITEGGEMEIRATKNGYRVKGGDGEWYKISLAMGATTGYQDPSF